MGSEHVFPEVIARLGPVEVTTTVVYSLVASAIVVAFALLVRFGLATSRSGWPVAAEFVVEHLEGIMRDMFDRDPSPYTPLVVTLALFIGTANLLGLAPGMRARRPTFPPPRRWPSWCSWRCRFTGSGPAGLRGYLRHYLEPTPLLLPLEIITEFSRTLALAVRLFGNMMSEELVIAVLLAIAGLLVPVPIMMLSVLTGVVQAYIFAVLTVVYLSAAVRAQKSK